MPHCVGMPLSVSEVTSKCRDQKQRHSDQNPRGSNEPVTATGQTRPVLSLPGILELKVLGDSLTAVSKMDHPLVTIFNPYRVLRATPIADSNIHSARAVRPFLPMTCPTSLEATVT